MEACDKQVSIFLITFRVFHFFFCGSPIYFDMIGVMMRKGLVSKMKWVSKDIETYLSAKEYVDTAVIPLFTVSFGNEMKQSASSAEFITLLTNYLERQFTGRLMLFPPFTYLKTDDLEEVFNKLKKLGSKHRKK